MLYGLPQKNQKNGLSKDKKEDATDKAGHCSLYGKENALMHKYISKGLPPKE